ncbi:hypothetical protein C0Q70_00841 [Pomacea canaliculata]|uniref:G-protein coupled receptors family 2 profile 2 domain-containing protein n=1 Tax=Pomacea canaliculata TaxID=400727 RepID=A0A2T7PXV8_POMCA|nr:hypothetical protein C0Q70_00841 [Pomacea canaliculata]
MLRKRRSVDDGSSSPTSSLAWLFPRLWSSPRLVGNYLASSSCDLDLGYGQGVCFLSNRLSLALACALPISLVIVISLVLFGLTLRSHWGQENCQRARMCSSVKLTSLTGMTWLAGVAAVGLESEVIWCTFLVLCGVHGVYMLVTFVCNKRAMNLYRKLFSRCQARKEMKARDDEHKEAGEELAPCLMDSKCTSVNQAELNGSMGNMPAVTDSKM